MKKLIALALILAMVFSLCACGSAPAGNGEKAESAAAPSGSASAGSTGSSGSDAAAAGPAAPEETVPEKVYVSKTVSAPLRMTEYGTDGYHMVYDGPVTHSGNRITEYTYDETGNVSSESVSYISKIEADWLQYAGYSDSKVVRNDAGELVSVSRTGTSIKSASLKTKWETSETGTYENGRLTQVEIKVPKKNITAEKVTLEYYPDGMLRRETSEEYTASGINDIKIYKSPLVTVREYDESGRCSLLHIEEFDLDTGGFRMREFKWTFDDAGRPSSVDYKDGAAKNLPIKDPKIVDSYTAEMQYDAEGRMVSASAVRNGKKVSFSYQYDESGRLTAYEASGAGKASSYEYGTDGLPNLEHRKASGKTRDIRYNWKEDKNGWKICTPSDGNRGFLLSNNFAILPDSMGSNGRLLDYTYMLLPSAASLEPILMERRTVYEYGDISILVEITPEQQAIIEAARAKLAAYYPDLNGSYCGVPVKTPSGGEKLVKITSQSTGRQLDMVTTFEYDEDGVLVGVTDAFDPVGSFDDTFNQKKDDQGRLAEIKMSDDWIVSFKYGDDPASYTKLEVDGGSRTEKTYTLNDQSITKWIKEKDEAYSNEYNSQTLNEDGLRNRWESSDGYVITYQYKAETYPDGSLKAVLMQIDDGSFFPIMEFDPAGYLTKYSAKSYDVTYYYE